MTFNDINYQCFILRETNWGNLAPKINYMLNFNKPTTRQILNLTIRMSSWLAKTLSQIVTPRIEFSKVTSAHV